MQNWNEVLLNSAQNSDFIQLQFAIENGANINIQDVNGYSPLMLAAKFDNWEGLTKLISEGAEINAQNITNISQLQKQLSGNHIKDSGIRVSIYNKQSNDGNTALIFAAKKGSRRCVESLVLAGANIDLANNLNSTAFLEIVKSRNTQCLEALFSNKVTPNWFEKNYIATLKAIEIGAVEIVKMVIKFGLNINAKFHRTFLINDATYYNRIEIVELLLSSGSEVNIYDDHGKTPLILAAEKGYVDCLEILILADANINYVDKSEGATALMWAADNNHADCLISLIKHTALLDVGGFSGVTALMRAADRGNLEILKILIAAGANINKKNPSGLTALMFAQLRKHKDCEEELIIAGADMDIKNEYGKTSWDYF